MTGTSQFLSLERPEWLEQMESVLEVLNEGVVITNDCHRILFVNSRFVEMTGISKEDLIGAESSQFYSLRNGIFLSNRLTSLSERGRAVTPLIYPGERGADCRSLLVRGQSQMRETGLRS